jgi:hypothetical protein
MHVSNLIDLGSQTRNVANAYRRVLGSYTWNDASLYRGVLSILPAPATPTTQRYQIQGNLGRDHMSWTARRLGTRLQQFRHHFVCHYLRRTVSNME